MIKQLKSRTLIHIFRSVLFCLFWNIAISTTEGGGSIRFAVIGDYGEDRQPFLAEVASMIDSWNVDFIVTVGDNNYPDGEAETIDANIGQYFHEHIHPYVGTYGEGAAINRFFPSLGNHDWTTDNAQPYFDYFTLPGNERYYDFVWGPVHFFILSSDDHEPDGNTEDSIQAQWLQERLSESTAAWQVAILHDPPYSSGWHGNTQDSQWPYKEWGVDVVLAGHDHHYERLMVDDLVYFVNGAGGDNLREVANPIEESQQIFSASFGAMLVIADENEMTFEFHSIAGKPLAWLNGGAIGEWLEFDVTPAIMGNGLYDFVVTTGSNTSIYLTAEECRCEDVPQLVIETANGTQPLAFTAVDDTYIRGDNPDRNYGDDEQLRLRNSELLDMNTYLRFSVAGLSGDVEQAQLRLHLEEGDVKGGFAVFSITEAMQQDGMLWTEDTLIGEDVTRITGANNPIDAYTITSSPP